MPSRRRSSRLQDSAQVAAHEALSQYVTTKQAAEMLGVGQEHIRKLLNTGRVSGVKLGHDWLVFAPSIQKYTETRSKRGRPRSGTPQLAIQSHGQG